MSRDGSGTPMETLPCVLQTADVAGAVVERNGRFRYVSPKFSELLGAEDRPKLEGTSFASRFVRSARRRIRSALRCVLEGKTRTFEAEAISADGHRVPLALQLVPLADRGSVRAARVLARDISKERAIERALEQRARELRTLTTILTAVAGARDPESIYREATDRLVRDLGYLGAVVVVAEPQGEDPEIRAAAGGAAIYARHVAKIDFRPFIRALQERTGPTVFRDPANDPRFHAIAEDLRRSGCRSIVAVPISTRPHVSGFLGVGSAQPVLGEDSLATLSEIGRTVGVGVERVELLQATRRHLQELAILKDVASEVTGTLALTPLLHALCTSLARLAAVPRCDILLHDARSNALVWAGGTSLSEHGTRRGEFRIPLAARRSAACKAFSTGCAVALEDARREAPWMPPTARLARPKSLLCVPLFVRGRPIGAIALADTRHTRRFTFEEVARVQTVANQAAMAIENARRYEEAVRSRRRAELLLETVRVASSCTELRGCLLHVARQLVKHTGSRDSTVFVADRRGEWIADVIDYGSPPTTLPVLHAMRGLRIRDLPIGRRILEVRHAFVIDNLVRSRLLPARLARGLDTGTVVVVPVWSRERLLAAFTLGHPRGKVVRVSEEELALLQGVAGEVAMVIENARAFEELERQQRALDIVTSRTIGAQEEERRRIARELHDGVSQSLSVVKYQLEYLARTSEGVSSEVTKTAETIGEAIRELRRLCMDLRPSQLDHLGLVATIEWHAKSVSDNTGLRVDVIAAKDLIPLPAETEINLFRIVQEALSNVVRHAAATRATVRIARSQGCLELVLSDNGRGFDPAQVLGRLRDGHGMGLLTMRERAHLLRGEFRLCSRAGRGTRIEVRIPIERASPPATSPPGIAPASRRSEAVAASRPTKRKSARYGEAGPGGRAPPAAAP